MLNEAGTKEGRKAYLEKRNTYDINSGLSSPTSEQQPPARQIRDETRIDHLTKTKIQNFEKTDLVEDEKKAREKEEIDSVIAEVEDLQVQLQ